MSYYANEKRYETMEYRRAGNSGLQLPVISFGLWHNFGTHDSQENMRNMCCTAFDLGITYFDLANNYGPVPGSAEENFGQILKNEFVCHRDELIIASKAGFNMWAGPYGDWGSRKYLMSSLDQSLKRMGLDYVDIFYHHRMDPNTPLEETMLALADIVRSGKALYVGLSNYDGATMEKANKLLEKYQVPFVVNQNNYSMTNTTVEENGLQKACVKEKKGIVAFCPLAQGLLTDKYIQDIPEDSRIKTSGIFLKSEQVTAELREKVVALNEIAKNRRQSLAQMALSYILSKDAMTTALIGASRPSQIEENVACLNNMNFTDDELKRIKTILK